MKKNVYVVNSVTTNEVFGCFESFPRAVGMVADIAFDDGSVGFSVFPSAEDGVWFVRWEDSEGAVWKITEHEVE